MQLNFERAGPSVYNVLRYGPTAAQTEVTCVGHSNASIIAMN